MVFLFGFRVFDDMCCFDQLVAAYKWVLWACAYISVYSGWKNVLVYGVYHKVCYVASGYRHAYFYSLTLVGKLIQS